MSELIKKIEHALNASESNLMTDVLNDCLQALSDEWISVDENNNHPDPEKHKFILGIDMKDSEPYVFECEWDGDTWSNIGGESFTHWKPSHRPK